MAKSSFSFLFLNSPSPPTDCSRWLHWFTRAFQRRRDILDGPYHSVLGDRVVKLGKPYREVVARVLNQGAGADFKTDRWQGVAANDDNLAMNKRNKCLWSGKPYFRNSLMNMLCRHAFNIAALTSQQLIHTLPCEVHDNNQIFPEFILYYKRSLGPIQGQLRIIFIAALGLLVRVIQKPWFSCNFLDAASQAWDARLIQAHAERFGWSFKRFASGVTSVMQPSSMSYISHCWSQ